MSRSSSTSGGGGGGIHNMSIVGILANHMKTFLLFSTCCIVVFVHFQISLSNCSSKKQSLRQQQQYSDVTSDDELLMLMASEFMEESTTASSVEILTSKEVAATVLFPRLIDKAAKFEEPQQQPQQTKSVPQPASAPRLVANPPKQQQTEKKQETIKQKTAEDEQQQQRSAAGLCPKEYFKVQQMKRCHKWLSCEEIAKVEKIKRIGGGFSKEAFTSNVPSLGIQLVMSYTRLNKVNNTLITSRVNRGLQNVIHFQTNPHMIQLAGYCHHDGETTIMTEDCSKYKTLSDFVASKHYKSILLKQRLQLVIDMVSGFVMIHNDKRGPIVHCDLHEANQALGQFLVTDNMRVVMNDLDETPTYDPNSTKIARCSWIQGCRTSRFLAPEQQYTTEYCKSRKRLGYPGYKRATPKSDTWKLPDMSDRVLQIGDFRQITGDVIGDLKRIRGHCKVVDEKKRWGSKQVLQAYKTLYKKYFG